MVIVIQCLFETCVVLNAVELSYFEAGGVGYVSLDDAYVRYDTIKYLNVTFAKWDYFSREFSNTFCFYNLFCPKIHSQSVLPVFNSLNLNVSSLTEIKLGRRFEREQKNLALFYGNHQFSFCQLNGIPLCIMMDGTIK